jgi:hypothetical protein
LAFGEKKDDWSAGAIAYCMKLGVQPAFRATDATGRISFFEQTGGSPVRLEMGAVNHHPAGGPLSAARLAKTRSKTPIRDQRTNRL